MTFRTDSALYNISKYWISLEVQEDSRRVNLGTKASSSRPVLHLFTSFMAMQTWQACRTEDLENCMRKRVEGM